MPNTLLPFYLLKTTNYTLLVSDDIVQFSCSGGSLVATLPDATTVPVAKRFEIRRAADATPANTLTVATTASQTIDGRASSSIILSPSNYLSVVSDGSNWQVVHANESIAMSYSDTSGGTLAITAGVYKYTTQQYDTHSAYSISTGVFTVPAAGRYRVSGMLNSVSALSTAQAFWLYIYKNGSQQVSSNLYGNTNNQQHSNTVTGTFSCAAGDTLQIFSKSDLASTAHTTAGENLFSIERIP